MDHGDIETLAARLRNLEEQLARGRRRLRSAAALALAGGVSAWAAVASSAPDSPLACVRPGLYCFGGGQPAVATEVNSNFETLARGIDGLGPRIDSAASAATSANSAAAAKLPLTGGTLTGPVTMNGATAIAGGNTSGNLHIDSSNNSEGRVYLNWSSGKGVVIANGAGTRLAQFNTPANKITMVGQRVPSEIAKAACNAGTCTANCPADTKIKLAFGFHGLSHNGATGDWSCGQAFQWLGNCIGASSCTVSASCGSSAVWAECW